jgi:anti-sigma regulatory factor (Ser/Thr protein kinase)
MASRDARRDAGNLMSARHQPAQRDEPFASAALTLSAAPESVSSARRFVRTALTDLDAPEACDDAVALVSELATNAVIHARTVYTIVVSRDANSARVGVHDLSTVVPRQRASGSDALTGRGLRLVASISSDWGVDLVTRGKGVWFTVSCAGGVEAFAGNEG